MSSGIAREWFEYVFLEAIARVVVRLFANVVANVLVRLVARLVVTEAASFWQRLSCG